MRMLFVFVFLLGLVSCGEVKNEDKKKKNQTTYKVDEVPAPNQKSNKIDTSYRFNYDNFDCSCSKNVFSNNSKEDSSIIINYGLLNDEEIEDAIELYSEDLSRYWFDSKKCDINLGLNHMSLCAYKKPLSKKEISIDSYGNGQIDNDFDNECFFDEGLMIINNKFEGFIGLDNNPKSTYFDDHKPFYFENPRWCLKLLINPNFIYYDEKGGFNFFNAVVIVSNKKSKEKRKIINVYGDWSPC